MVDLAPLLSRIKDLFSREDRPGGREAVTALEEVLASSCVWEGVMDEFDPAPLAQLKKETTATGFRPFLKLLPDLNWHYSGLSDGRIREEIARKMLTVELIGPHGMLPHDTVRVGLFFQDAALDYVTREHSAEETFIMVSGQAFWSRDNHPLEGKNPGDIIHHPSMAPHKSVTDKSSVLAVWRWTGDIAYENYTLTG